MAKRASLRGLSGITGLWTAVNPWKMTHAAESLQYHGMRKDNETGAGRCMLCLTSGGTDKWRESQHFNWLLSYHPQ